MIAAMGWEVVDELPSARGSGAFRDGAEPIVVERSGITIAERARLLWHSSPELRAGRAAKRVVLTPQHVYVERLDGSRARVRHDALHGERLAGGRVIYGVTDDEDLLLVYRSTCALQDRLAALVRGGDAVEPWRVIRGLTLGIVATCVAIATGIAMLLEYRLSDAMSHFARGQWTSEIALGTYAGFLLIALGVVIFLWGPSHWRVDAVTVTRTRGVIPWLPFSLPPERLRRVLILPFYLKPKYSARYHAGNWVALELREPARLGTFWKQKHVKLEAFGFGNDATAEKRAKVEDECRAFASRLRSLLRLEPTHSPRRLRGQP